MYILKNALRCITRSMGRNVLIGIIVLVIATSSCIGLSIRQAGESAREDTLASMSITAQISLDRQSMMGNFGGMGGMGGKGDRGEGGFNREDFFSAMQGTATLTLEEYTAYSKADSVSDFYYTLTCYINGSDGFSPLSDTDDEEEGGTISGTITEEDTNDMIPEDAPMGGMPGSDFGGMIGGFINIGEFTAVGYSSDRAMTDFYSGDSSVSDGRVFEEGTLSYECIISSELATFNNLSVGDTVTLSNPKNEAEVYTLTIVGIYTSQSANDTGISATLGAVVGDPANRIYMSYATLKDICDKSEGANITVTDEESGRESDSKLTGTLSAVYCFDDAESYYKFEEEARALGLDDSYTVSSSDITAFERSLVPLDTLSDMAGTFFIVILVIGAIILVVLNIFNIRERKYEIGVLTAMGMKKYKVALQFISEIFVITLVAVMIGSAVGAATSVPITNALLENQIVSAENTANRNEQNFGREPGEMGGPMGGQMGGQRPSLPDNVQDINKIPVFGEAAEYISEINSATDLSVIAYMAVIALLLTLVSGAASMLFIMRYDPLRILSGRD